MVDDQSAGDSVYDFLYIDARRIAQFLSQFTDYGHLTSLTRSASESHSGGGGVNVGIGKLDTTAGSQTTQVRQFDPQWIAPLTFLDQANQKGLIVRGLSRARIGQFVLTSGTLAVLDLTTLKALWDIPIVQTIIAQGVAPANIPQQFQNRQERRATGSAGQQKSDSATAMSYIKSILEIIKVLPHGLQVRLLTDSSEPVWCDLRDESLLVSSAGMMLKQGVVLSGTWDILGILDALPDSQASQSNTHLNEAKMLQSLTEIANVMASLGPIARQALGRPNEAYGITPLLIFREVSV